jgi:quinoprotein dehydrogenase-associated probable ABC transporter substrate-binding protein
MSLIRTGLVGCSLLLALIAPLHPCSAQSAPNNKEWEDYDQVERDQARSAARDKHYSSFRVCADPGNMPLSDKDGRGFENRLAELIARAFGARATFFWRPYVERGVTRQTFDENACDAFMDVPAGYGMMLTTTPIYRSTYVLASRTARHLQFNGLSDPQLKHLQIGAYELSAVRQALAEHGVVGNVKIHEVSYDGDLVESHQPWWQVRQMIDGELDVAAVWGPLAGWLKARGAPITLQPTNRMDDLIPMEFDISIGVRKTDVVLKFAIEDVLEAHRAEVRALLDEYGFPLVTCGECVISGNISAHGLYTKPVETAEQARLREHPPPAVPIAQLDSWLAAGADPNQELLDAVVGDDPARITRLLGKGADPNRPGLDGTPPLVTAAKAGETDAARLLLAYGARTDLTDADGWAPVLSAAAYNHPEIIRLLASRGASVDTSDPNGFTPLAVASEEGKYDAALALLELRANPNARGGQRALTPLMVVASQRPPDSRAVQLTQAAGPIELARALLAHGADVNATDADGVTALMIAAARNNPAMISVLVQAGARLDLRSSEGRSARDIAVENENQSALRVLDLLAPNRVPAPPPEDQSRR